MKKIIKKEKNEKVIANSLKFMSRLMLINLAIVILTLNKKRDFLLRGENIDFVYANTSLIVPLLLFLIVNITGLILYQYKMDK